MVVCPLQKEEELLSIWWKEYADCSEGPKEPKASSSKLDAQLRSSVLESDGSPQLFTAEEERVGVPVKGGLYEVPLVKLMIVTLIQDFCKLLCATVDKTILNLLNEVIKNYKHLFG